MLTSKEAQLGSLMARIAALGTIVVFAVQALLIGPDQVGYSTEYGAIVDIVSFVQTFGILFTISLTQKLFGDNNPYFRIVSAILFVAAVIQLTGSLSSTGNANSVFDSVLSPDQANAVANNGQLVTFLLYGIWALCLISADENNRVPSWGKNVRTRCCLPCDSCSNWSIVWFDTNSCFCSSIHTWRGSSFPCFCIWNKHCI